MFPEVGHPAWDWENPPAECPNNFSDYQCERIELALSWLQSHEEVKCRNLGFAAQSRWGGHLWNFDAYMPEYAISGWDSQLEAYTTQYGPRAFEWGELTNTNRSRTVPCRELGRTGTRCRCDWVRLPGSEQLALE